ncbi:MAG: OmpA family protein, partial [bacterium]
VTRVVLALTFTLALMGCPKKCVKPVEEEPVLVEEPQEEEIEVAPAKVEVTLQPIYFDLDKSEIRSGDASILQANAEQIKKAVQAGQKFSVIIEGHCCPLGTSEYNMALGMRRAESAKSYLVRLGVDANILNTISYGEERLVTNDPDKYHLNRRCEFRTETK